MDSKEANNLTSIDTYLLEQQTLTAVERFSDLHDSGLKSPKGRSYRALIPGNPPQPGQQYAFEVDLDKCSGCKSCVTGCHTRNGLDPGETWRSVGLVHGVGRQLAPVRPMNASELACSVKSQCTDEQRPSSLSPIPSPERLKGFVRETSEFKLYFQQNITSACHHCDDPACLTGCPVKAYDKNPVTGVVKHLDDQCIGCKYCIYRCPYGVPQYNEKKGIVRKCDMCTDRLETGEAPACIQSCPNEAISITLISVKALKENPSKHFNVSSFPDPFYTRPSTRYKTERKIPEHALAADHAVLAPQPSEIPLVFMLVFTQLSVGAISLLAILQAISYPATELFIKLQGLIALTFGCMGLGLATLHLGRPLYAFRSFIGFATSWLSREVVFFTFYINLLMFTVLLAWFPFHISPFFIFPPFLKGDQGRFFLRGIYIFTATLGILGVFSSSMIYKATPRPWWNSSQTILKFFLTTALLGIGLTMCVMFPLYKGGVPVFPPFSKGDQGGFFLRGIYFPKLLMWGLIIGVILKLAIEIKIFSHLKEPQDHPLRKTALLIKNTFRHITQLRFISLILGTLCSIFPPFLKGDQEGILAFLPFLRGEQEGILTFLPFLKGEQEGFFLRMILPWLGLALLILGECLERHLFFRAVVPPKMPGLSILE